MKQQNQQIADERIQFMQKWLTSASSHQSWDCSQFLQTLFKLVNSDIQTQQIFIKHLPVLLQSRQNNVDAIFQYVIKQSSKQYDMKVCEFLKLYMNEKNEISLSFKMQKYIINNIWRQNMLRFINYCNFSPSKIIEHLSLKMRSLNSQIRHQALNSLFAIIQQILQGWKGPFSIQIQNTLPEMIEKQNYSKQVCYSRGVLLQILQDEHCHIKKRGIQLLGKAQSFFNTKTIRPLILYMLNDEHQAVRQTSLVVLSQIPELDIEKEDLSALLVCLKENNSIMRSYTYENLSHINITSSEDFKIIMDRLFYTLSNRTQDKKKVYIVCSKLAQKYPDFVLSNLDSIYKFSDNEEPNWKAIVYRARLITVAAIGIQKWPKTLPKYFTNHYLYMRDVILYAFEPVSTLKKPITDISEQTSQNTGVGHQISINLVTNWQIYQYVQATSYITKGFLKTIFTIIHDFFKETNLTRTYTNEMKSKFQNQIEKLWVTYDVYCSKIAKQIINLLQHSVEEGDIDYFRKFVLKIRQGDIWTELQKIQNIIFKVSNIDRSKIVISNQPQVLKKSFIEFCTSSHSPNNEGKNNAWYLRMSQVQFEQVNSRLCYFKVNFKYKQVRCIILYGHPPNYYISDSVSSDEWFSNYSS